MMSSSDLERGGGGSGGGGRVRQFENRGCVKWFRGERKSRLPPSLLPLLRFSCVLARKCSGATDAGRRLWIGYASAKLSFSLAFGQRVTYDQS